MPTVKIEESPDLYPATAVIRLSRKPGETHLTEQQVVRLSGMKPRISNDIEHGQNEGAARLNHKDNGVRELS